VVVAPRCIRQEVSRQEVEVGEQALTAEEAEALQALHLQRQE